MDKVPLCKECANFVDLECADVRNKKDDLVRGGIRFMLWPADLRDIESKCGPTGAWFNRRIGA